ncbi:MAG TPA: O-antigen ligase family protein [Phenylobacterium sp.]|uniref:O-antigen ligase family protein n=1 Tax=Phenylobacterium sp. TaxID=1871053 RepID=UPI002B475154|nr:O-antigen ligase family protein [Phenylobacterium sp.]HKR87789.1 O-antigen ligase family protein [Phenylobacterium sp.]
MTATVMTQARQAARGGLAAWCGWVNVGAAVLIPLIGWLSPLGFAPLLAVMGVLSLGAFRITDNDRPVLIVLLGALVWGAVSTTWSPSHPKQIDHRVIVQLALALPLFWSALCGARRADPRLNDLALKVLGWGLAFYAVMLLADVFTNARFYQALHERFLAPIAMDRAQTNVGHSSFILAVLWPVVMVGTLKRYRQLVLLAATILGTVLAADVFNADAPVLAFPLSAIAMLLVWLQPRLGPRLMAGGAAAFTLLMPALIWMVRISGDYGFLEHAIPYSWGARMSYWSHTLDWISQEPVRGWGLDASRAMGNGIDLHPHNAALQVWLELGLIGAVAAAAFWGLSLIRLEREEPDLGSSAVAGSVVAFLLFAWLNYGIWQQWWMALGAFIPVLAAMLQSSAGNTKST